MYFYSTRKECREEGVSISQAMLKGMAADGGLFIPEKFPLIDWKTIDRDISYQDFAKLFLKPFFFNDPLVTSLNHISDTCFNFDLPIIKLNQQISVLELFHGPTLSFKDFGARFLAGCLESIPKDKVMTIMVATSGDTGSAVAAAFYKKKNIRVVILFPENKITQRQQDQITCWGDNILPISVKGDFDDCQRLVKSSFCNKWWIENTMLNTSNSINIGRILPQATYYAYTSWRNFLLSEEKTNYIVPSGNIGNITAAYWAKKCGFPIEDIVASQNANNTIVNYLNHNIEPNQDTIETVANAMDVGKPSNFERLKSMFTNRSDFLKNVQAYNASDMEILDKIKDIYKEFTYIVCPHTATAFCAYENIKLNNEKWTIISTADPSKFEEVIDRSIEIVLPPGKRLQSLLDRKQYYTSIESNMDSLKQAYIEFFI
jgi:threonine synthase